MALAIRDILTKSLAAATLIANGTNPATTLGTLTLAAAQTCEMRLRLTLTSTNTSRIDAAAIILRDTTTGADILSWVAPKLTAADSKIVAHSPSFVFDSSNTYTVAIVMNDSASASLTLSAVQGMPSKDANVMAVADSSNSALLLSTFTVPVGFPTSTFSGTIANTGNITGGTMNLTGTTTNLTNNTPTAGTITVSPAPTAGTMTLTGTTTNLTNNTPTGGTVMLSSAYQATLVQAVWDAATSALTAAGSVGKRFLDFVTTLVYGAAPTAAAVRSEMDTNSTKLANLDATVSSRFPTASYVVPPTSSQIRIEMDSNSTKLANLDATISSRLASGPVTVGVDNATTVRNVNVTLINGSRNAAINLSLVTNDTNGFLEVTTRLAWFQGSIELDPAVQLTLNNLAEDVSTIQDDLGPIGTNASNAASSASTAATNTTALPGLVGTDNTQFTAHALVLAGGGGGLTTNQAQTLADLKQMISDPGSTNAQFTVTALANAPSGGGSLGPGASQCTLNIKTDLGVIIANAQVWLTSDSAGSTVVAGTGQTDDDGNVKFLLDDGASYYLWVKKSGIVSIAGRHFTAVAD